jgi:hypothetical protein
MKGRRSKRPTPKREGRKKTTKRAPTRVTLSIRSDDSLYALEKLNDAVHALATGIGRVQERLMEAAGYLHSVRPDEIPDDELRRILKGVKDDLTFDTPTGSEGRIISTLLKTPDADASVIADRILNLYRALWDRLMR